VVVAVAAVATSVAVAAAVISVEVVAAVNSVVAVVDSVVVVASVVGKVVVASVVVKVAEKEELAADLLEALDQASVVIGKEVVGVGAEVEAKEVGAGAEVEDVDEVTQRRKNGSLSPNWVDW